MEKIVAFRTHVWNKEVSILARRIRGACIKARFVIIADETNGILDVSPFEKISHRKDFSHFGLPSFPPDKVLWYNADYPMYVLAEEFPNSSHILMIENDVTVNIDLDSVFEAMEIEGIDFLAHKVEPSNNAWLWHHTLEPHFAEPHKCLLMVLGLSRRAIDVLLTERLRIARDWRVDASTQVWPYCEGFVASALMERDDIKTVDISRFADTRYYNFDGAIHPSSSEARRSGSICHPVVCSSFLKRRLDRDGLSAIFDRNSLLRRTLASMDSSEFYPALIEKVRRHGSLRDLIRFNSLALLEGWIMRPEAINWALRGWTNQSSVSPWSRSDTTELDSAHAVNGNLDDDNYFHTNNEVNPWWYLHLSEKVAVRHILIYNRSHFQERCRNMRIEVSGGDDDSWHTVLEKMDDIDFGREKRPFVVTLDGTRHIQNLRITLLGKGILHLRQIEVFDQ
ncbi:galactose-binding domain-containing protein [Brytella acorum]|uniref:Discoidin domain-containing protein n=1 Tax=Brytella acorum TaxID=2959299 RepID=A0AA35UZK8_9PROT|nr:discoidin domain-containing protein [Brytella acorum]CAI9122395.1 discoidin domain-containing protein [Brytella acorum]